MMLKVTLVLVLYDRTAASTFTFKDFALAPSGSIVTEI